jgi:hypothetical protein
MFRRDLLKLAAGLVLLPGAVKRVFSPKAEAPAIPADATEYRITVMGGEWEFVIHRWGQYRRGSLSVTLNGKRPTSINWGPRPRDKWDKQRAAFNWAEPGTVDATLDLSFPAEADSLLVNSIRVVCPLPTFGGDK